MSGTKCRRGKVWRNETFQTTAYPGSVYRIYKVIESDEGGFADFQTLTDNQTDDAGDITCDATCTLCEAVDAANLTADDA